MSPVTTGWPRAALLSLSDKTGAVEFARALRQVVRGEVVRIGLVHCVPPEALCSCL